MSKAECVQCHKQRRGVDCEYCEDHYCSNCTSGRQCSVCLRFRCVDCSDRGYKGPEGREWFEVVTCYRCPRVICSNSEECSGYTHTCPDHRKDNDECQASQDPADGYLEELAAASTSDSDSEADERKEQEEAHVDA